MRAVLASLVPLLFLAPGATSGATAACAAAQQQSATAYEHCEVVASGPAGASLVVQWDGSFQIKQRDGNFSVSPESGIARVRSDGSGRLRAEPVRLPHIYQTPLRVVANDNGGILLQDDPEKFGQPRQWYIPWHGDGAAEVTARTWKSYRFDRVLRNGEDTVYVALNGQRRTAVRYRGGGEFAIVPEPEAARLLASLWMVKRIYGPQMDIVEEWHVPPEIRTAQVALMGATCWTASSEVFEPVPGVFYRQAQGKVQRFALTRQTPAELRRLRPEEYKRRSYPVQPDEIVAAIGPMQSRGDRIWFGRLFYNGEGLTGVGGFGYLDCATGEFREVFPPQAVPYSTVAILVEEDAVWLSLGSFEEYFHVSGGLLRWNRADESTRHFPTAPMATDLVRDHGDLVIPYKTGVAVLRDGAFTAYTLLETPDGALQLQRLR